MTTTLKRTENGYQAGDTEVRTSPLSPREAQLAALSATGLSRAECGQVMGITPNTVAKTAARLYFKLHVNSMLAAMAEARKRGYIRFGVLALLVLMGSTNINAARPPRPPARISSSVRSGREQHAAA